MSKLELILAILAVIQPALGRIAMLLPPSKFQHWLAWAGSASAPKPLEPAPKGDA